MCVQSLMEELCTSYTTAFYEFHRLDISQDNKQHIDLVTPVTACTKRYQRSATCTRTTCNSSPLALTRSNFTAAEDIIMNDQKVGPTDKV